MILIKSDSSQSETIFFFKTCAGKNLFLHSLRHELRKALLHEELFWIRYELKLRYAEDNNAMLKQLRYAEDSYAMLVQDPRQGSFLEKSLIAW